MQHAQQRQTDLTSAIIENIDVRLLRGLVNVTSLTVTKLAD